ncbi:MAG TPA: FAD-dependent monooxygenase [Methylovirgula sp.]
MRVSRRCGGCLISLPDNTGSPHVLIAGAGVGGLTAAIALARRGWRITLIERGDGNENIGAGLQLSPNASGILRDLGVLPGLAAAGLAPDAIHIRRARDGATLARLPLADAERRWGAPYLNVHRADLVRILRETALADPNVSFHPQTILAGFEQTANGVRAVGLRGPIRIGFEADCLIGADGVRSFVRARSAALRGKLDDMPTQTRYAAWRTLIAAAGVAEDMRLPASNLWLGQGAHVVHYPLRAGKMINIVAVVDTREMLDEKADLWSQKGDPAWIAARLAHWAPPIRDLAAKAAEWRVWPLIERETPAAWSHGRVALLGDAAHAMLPFLAQGAAQAIEDAAALAAALDPGGDIIGALAAYSAKRAPRAARVQSESRRQARIYHLGLPASLARDMALRSLGSRLSRRYDWLYGAKNPAIS